MAHQKPCSLNHQRPHVENFQYRTCVRLRKDLLGAYSRHPHANIPHHRQIFSDHPYDLAQAPP